LSASPNAWIHLAGAVRELSLRAPDLRAGAALVNAAA
jgi:UDP-N-acetylglucosamine enolpyruvyl transferase